MCGLLWCGGMDECFVWMCCMKISGWMRSVWSEWMKVLLYVWICGYINVLHKTKQCTSKKKVDECKNALRGRI